MRNRKLILTVLIFAITFVLSGCSSDSKTFNNAIEKLQNAKNYRVKLNYEFDSTDSSLQTDMDITMDMDVENENEFAIKTEIEVSGQTVETYIISEDNSEATMYMKLNLFGQEVWWKMTQDVNDLLEDNELNNVQEDKMLEQLYESTKIKFLEEKEIDGTTYKKFEVNIDMSEFYEEYLPFDEDYKSLDPDMEEYLNAVQNDIKEIFNEFNMIVYINPEDETVYRIDFDFTDAMQAIYDDIVESGIDANYEPIFTSFKFSMIFDKINEIEVILPDEAQNAVDVADLLGNN